MLIQEYFSKLAESYTQSSTRLPPEIVDNLSPSCRKKKRTNQSHHKSTRFFSLSLFLLISPPIHANAIQQEWEVFSKSTKIALSPLKIAPALLPMPYSYLLTQPLMTLGIEKYYQRTPIIHTIYAVKNQKTNTYSRAILMLLDSRKTRNNAKIAQEKKEEVTVELAFITINFNELPEKVINDILNTSVPFGKLLIVHHLKTSSSKRLYFSLQCSKELAKRIGCKINNQIYARMNTIVRKDNKKWLAQVIEILPGVQALTSTPKGGITF
jgi:hypothetical protein